MDNVKFTIMGISDRQKYFQRLAWNYFPLPDRIIWMLCSMMVKSSGRDTFST